MHRCSIGRLQICASGSRCLFFALLLFSLLLLLGFLLLLSSLLLLLGLPFKLSLSVLLHLFLLLQMLASNLLQHLLLYFLALLFNLLLLLLSDASLSLLLLLLLFNLLLLHFLLLFLALFFDESVLCLFLFLLFVLLTFTALLGLFLRILLLNELLLHLHCEFLPICQHNSLVKQFGCIHLEQFEGFPPLTILTITQRAFVIVIVEVILILTIFFGIEIILTFIGKNRIFISFVTRVVGANIRGSHSMFVVFHIKVVLLVKYFLLGLNGRIFLYNFRGVVSPLVSSQFDRASQYAIGRVHRRGVKAFSALLLHTVGIRRTRLRRAMHVDHSSEHFLKSSSHSSHFKLFKLLEEAHRVIAMLP
mmetsp:Transcript_2143/g.7799  ORF Transcript_2143/g.7799 Transcript_2143/m.7799 type:complete len:362 (-) Transcript_2143:932-2017(-)